MIGIYDWFGYDVAIEDRYKLIREAGFDQVMLWWSDGFGRGIDYRNGVRHARNAGLYIENMHTPVQKQNNLSLDNLDGNDLSECYQQCIRDCVEYDIPTMVIHLPNDKYPLNSLGMERISKLAEQAEKHNVNVAFENLGNIQNLALVMNTVKSNRIGYCYDSCHHANYASEADLLGLYGDRMMAMHLHDNGGEKNQHQLPFDGHQDWTAEMKAIANTGYQGSTTLEPMNWGYENLTMQEFLSRAYDKATRLDDMRRTFMNEQS